MSREDEYYDEEDDAAPRSRVLSMASMLVGVAALAGFIWLAWHAYTSGSATYDPAEAELVKADAAPYKDVPTDPGGWQAPHRDKTIYEVIEGGNGAKTGNIAERLSPAPEEPMDIATAPASATKENAKGETRAGSSRTWMNAKLRDDGSEVPLTDAERQKTEREEHHSGATPDGASVNPAETSAAALIEPTKASKKMEALLPKNGPVEQLQPVTQPVIAKAGATSASGTAKNTKTAAKPAVNAANSKVRVQLGAFRSEAEAAAHVKHLVGRAPGAIAGHATSVERADLGAKGIYYRLFALGFADKNAAVATCDTIKAARLDCMVK